MRYSGERNRVTRKPTPKRTEKQAKQRQSANPNFNKASYEVAELAKRSSVEERVAAEMPDWMRDPGLLPKKPPGRA